MRKLGFMVVAASAALVAGCGHRGFDRHSSPDELAVARQAPLVIPPDYALQPPRPGAPNAGASAAQTEALDALFGGSAPRSAGERAALQGAGEDAADPGVRSSAGDPGTAVTDKAATTRDIVAAPEGDGRDARAAAQ